MKIVIDEDIPFIKERIGGETETMFLPGSEINKEHLRDADALVVRTRTKCNSRLLEGTPVRLIATATIGTEHIDLPWCLKNGVKVKSAPGCNAPGVAQYVFASLFKSGFNPESHTLGIIGHGNVGSLVGEWANQMGIKTLVNDPPKYLKEDKPENHRDLETLLESCDAVTMHVPLTNDGDFPTRHLIGRKELLLMKPGSIIVNSARGGVVDEKTLVQAIGNKRLSAIVDVWENEPLINRELLRLASIATPHIAGYSLEGKMRGTRMVLEALEEALGLSVDISGLECNREERQPITATLIENSFNPIQDSMQLKENPEEFETLRNRYNYRHEPFFIDEN